MCHSRGPEYTIFGSLKGPTSEKGWLAKQESRRTARNPTFINLNRYYAFIQNGAILHVLVCVYFCFCFSLHLPPCVFQLSRDGCWMLILKYKATQGIQKWVAISENY